MTPVAVVNDASDDKVGIVTPTYWSDTRENIHDPCDTYYKINHIKLVSCFLITRESLQRNRLHIDKIFISAVCSNTNLLETYICLRGTSDQTPNGYNFIWADDKQNRALGRCEILIRLFRTLFKSESNIKKTFMTTHL